MPYPIRVLSHRWYSRMQGRFRQNGERQDRSREPRFLRLSRNGHLEEAGAGYIPSCLSSANQERSPASRPLEVCTVHIDGARASDTTTNGNGFLLAERSAGHSALESIFRETGDLLRLLRR